MFCHRYPIGACVTGNGEVRSLRDNVALDCQHQGGRELGLSGVVNPGESLKSVVTYDKPKMLIGLNQNDKWSSSRANFSLLAYVEPPAQ
jgi:hypothetical protein